MNPNSEEFEEFLRNLGVELGGDTRSPQFVHSEPFVTMLQQSRYHEAFYRVDWMETGPHLLVLIPANDAPLKFHFYRVQLSESNPLFDVMNRLVAYERGSEGFEQERGFVEWQLLYSIVETMKTLFWQGLKTCDFPHEITIEMVC